MICSVEWLLNAGGAAPYILYTNANQSIAAEPERNTVLKELVIFQANHSDTVFIEVQDDCMHPYYESTDFVAGIKLNEKNLHA